MKLWANHNFELPKAKSNVHCHVFLFGLWCTSCFCILLARCHARRGFFCKIFTSFINFIIYKIRLRSTPSRSPNIYPHFSPSWYIYNHTDPSSNLIMNNVHSFNLFILACAWPTSMTSLGTSHFLHESGYSYLFLFLCLILFSFT